MKKILFSLIAVIAGAMSSYAQSALVATLSHGSNITPYYGESAFVEAYTAAVDGDCITLSAGAFTTVESIEKAITVRGAGFKGDGTTLSGAIYINIEQKSEYPLIFEGVQMLIGTISGDKTQVVQFIKSYITGHSYNTVNLNGCSNSFIHCILCSLDMYVTVLNANVYNCIVDGDLKAWYGQFYVKNCFLSSPNGFGVKKSTFENCIFYYRQDALDSSNVVEHCVGYRYQDLGNGTQNFFINTASTTNTMVNNLADLFKSYNNGDVMVESNFELTDAAKAQYKGADGTEVGIFGGANPYSTATTNPRITNFSITTNTEDGLLKVKLNVE